MPTASPAARSSPAKATRSPVNLSSGTGRSGTGRSGTGRSGTGASGTGGDLLQVVPDPLDVVAVLDHGAESIQRVAGFQVGLAQEVQGPRPVDGLRHSGRLGQVELAEPVYGGDHLAGQRGGNARLPDQDDLDLALGGRGADPAGQGAAPER